MENSFNLKPNMVHEITMPFRQILNKKIIFVLNLICALAAG